MGETATANLDAAGGKPRREPPFWRDALDPYAQPYQDANRSEGGSDDGRVGGGRPIEARRGFVRPAWVQSSVGLRPDYGLAAIRD